MDYIHTNDIAKKCAVTASQEKQLYADVRISKVK